MTPTRWRFPGAWARAPYDAASRPMATMAASAARIMVMPPPPWAGSARWRSADADVLDDAPGAAAGGRADDVEVAPRVAPDAVARAEAGVAPLGEPLPLEGEDADEAAVVLGNVDDVGLVHVEHGGADQPGGPEPEEMAGLVEDLHAVVLAIAHEDPAVPVDPHAVRQVELSGGRARLAPRRQVSAVGGELV